MQQIDAVLSASFSVFRSSRLKKVFEVITNLSLVSYDNNIHSKSYIHLCFQIILAFGNYMNSSRRGAVYGFKLESLSKVGKK